MNGTGLPTTTFFTHTRFNHHKSFEMVPGTCITSQDWIVVYNNS